VSMGVPGVSQGGVFRQVGGGGIVPSSQLWAP
jgi:hypothetical protein